MGGACSLAALHADVVRIQATQDPGLRMTFKGWGLDDAGEPCAIQGIERPAGCTRFMVRPHEHGPSGTIRLW